MKEAAYKVTANEASAQRTFAEQYQGNSLDFFSKKNFVSKASG